MRVAAACGTAALATAAVWWVVRSRRRVKQPSDAAPSGLIFTGTGCSSGLPLVPCALGVTVKGCEACAVALRRGASDKNWRGNVGCLLRAIDAKTGERIHVQIDCGKTFRETACLRVYRAHGVTCVDAVVLTHDHADAVGGLDELRSLQPFDPQTYQIMRPPIQVVCDRRTLTRLRHMFPYLHPKKPSFAQNGHQWRTDICVACELDIEPIRPPAADTAAAPPEPPPTPPAPPAPPEAGAVRRYVAKLDWRAFGASPDAAPSVSTFDVCGLEMLALPVLHGADYTCYGFAFGPEDARVVYLSDYTALLPSTEALLSRWSALGHIDLLVLDALRMEGAHPVHATGEESVQLARRLRPRRTLLVGMGHTMEHEATNRQLRRLWVEEELDVQLAYDGQFLPIPLSTSVSV